MRLRTSLFAAALTLLTVTGPVLAGESPHEKDGPKTEQATKPGFDEIIARLKSGNEAFVKGKSERLHQDLVRIKEVASQQKPLVTVLSCSDSRVPVELLFDEGIGDVFTVRVAGNVADTDELGTIEYGVGHLETPVLVVMGHTRCGAVTAVATGAEVHGHIPELVDNIAPAVAAEKAKAPNADSKAIIEPAIKANVFQSMADVITKSDEVRERLKDGKVRIVGALYHLEDGTVEWLGEHPDQKALIIQGDAAPEEAGVKKGPKKPGEASEKGGVKNATAKGAAKHEDKEKEKEKEKEVPDAGPSPEASAEEPQQPAPSPFLPAAFAFVAVIGCIAGAVSARIAMK